MSSGETSDQKPPAASPKHADAPPNAAFAEVVWMARVAPEAAIEDATAVVAAGFETGELPVGDAFEQEPERREREAEPSSALEWSGAELRCEQRRRHYPCEHRLQSEHEVQAFEREVRFVAPADLAIAVIFAFAPVAPGDVDTQAQRPERDDRKHECAARRDVLERPRVAHRCDDEHRAPDAVDDADVALGEAHEPRGHGRRKQQRQREQIDAPIKHGRAPQRAAALSRRRRSVRRARP